jgi:RND family efflux transporter MFP subunit
VVEKGDLLFQIDPRPFQAVLDEAKGLLAQSEARLVRAQAETARNERLLPKGAASRRDLEAAIADRDETQGAIQAARAALDRAALDMEFTRVTAPISGRVSRYVITEGNLVTADTTLLTTIVSIDPMYAYFDVDEATVLRVRQLIREGNMPVIRGGELPIRLSLGDNDGFPHEGAIDFAENRVDPETGTLRLRGVFPNQGELLLPGFFVRIRVPIGKAHQALLVSERAIDNDQGQKIVYIVDDANQVVSHPIRVGSLHDGLREIVEGVQPGERVVVDSLLRVRPGITVEPKLVDMPISHSAK